MNKKEFIRPMKVNNQEYYISDINLLQKKGIADISNLPFSIKILIENLLRKLDHHIVLQKDLLEISGWKKKYTSPVEIPYHPARVLMQDFTGVPAVVDLASMRDAMKDQGLDPVKINPLVPVELVVDHSIQVDYYGHSDALKKNVDCEYQRNKERYELLKWAWKNFDNFRVVPPNSGICHQVNLEYLGRVVMTEYIDGKSLAYPDTLVGTDSHTTMINSIGVMGWGVGGIEAEAVTLGQPYYISIPEVIGVKLMGDLKLGVTATDLVLFITELLRNHGVVEKFVEFFGQGMKTLSVPDRATISNMSPEYGATMGFFPVDEKTIEYLKFTNREEKADLVDIYTKTMGLFYTGESDPEYSEVIEFDLGSVEPCVAGPARPQDRISVKQLKDEISSRLPKESASIEVPMDGEKVQISNGSVVIAAITSCTNTSNPYGLIGAALLARNAVKRGLKVPKHVKTSFAPGSRVVIRYLNDGDLMKYFETLGFHLAAFGCTTCIGNSGPLHPEIEKAITENDLNTASILSGNRNFEARIHQKIKSNYLGSPMLVVAYALSGKMNIDLTTDSIAIDQNDQPIYLKDIWPDMEEIENLVESHVKMNFYKEEYEKIFDGDEFWQALKITESATYDWDSQSTYIKNPPYFDDLTIDPEKTSNVEKARALLLLGNTVTTDHISPAGAIPEDYPAGQYLMKKKVRPADFNSYGSRRGNHEVMMRGTFGNIRIKNRLVAPKEGSYTLSFPEKKEDFIYQTAMEYTNKNIPLIVLGGQEYGTGSSRDWAAKGTNLLGVKAVIAESFERIHRSNLVGMGVLPLVFKKNQNIDSLGIDGSEEFYLQGIDQLEPRKMIQIKAIRNGDTKIEFEVISRLDTQIEVEYFNNGGILHYVLRKLIKS